MVDNEDKTPEYKFIEILDKLANELQEVLISYSNKYGDVTLLINKNILAYTKIIKGRRNK